MKETVCLLSRLDRGTGLISMSQMKAVSYSAEFSRDCHMSQLEPRYRAASPATRRPPPLRLQPAMRSTRTPFKANLLHGNRTPYSLQAASSSARLFERSIKVPLRRLFGIIALNFASYEESGAFFGMGPRRASISPGVGAMDTVLDRGIAAR